MFKKKKKPQPEIIDYLKPLTEKEIDNLTEKDILNCYFTKEDIEDFERKVMRGEIPGYFIKNGKLLKKKKVR